MKKADILHGSGESAIKRKRKGLRRKEGTIEKRKRTSKGREEDIGLLAIQKSEKKEGKVKVESLPVLVLEKVFSYLDWKDLGAVMLVCRSWSNVGGHPSLWAGFPLHLTQLADWSFSKIRRLDWVKSLTISPQLGMELKYCGSIVEHFGRMEELFVDGCGWGVDISDDIIMNLLRAQASKKRLVRFGVTKCDLYPYDISKVEYFYFVQSCDAATNAFVKKTQPSEENDSVSISGLQGVHLSFEILETICRQPKRSLLMLRTNLIIGQNIEVLKLTEFLKCHVRRWDIGLVNEQDLENQELVSINAILDLLGSENNGKFKCLGLPKELVIKSDWAERLGGTAKVEACEDEVGSVRIKHCTKYGLKLLNANTEEQEGSEDDSDEDDDDEEEDDGDDDDEEEEKNMGQGV